MNRRTIAPTVAGWAAVIVLAGSCTSAGAPGPRSTAPASGAQKPAATPTATAAAPVGRDDNLLILRMAVATPGAAYALIAPGANPMLLSLPDGVASRDWRTLVSLEPSGGSTRVVVTIPEGGDGPVRIPVQGAWRLPTIGVTHQAAGLSADGSTLVLEEAGDAGPATATSRTRFAVVPTTGSKVPRIITLTGSFSYDALSQYGQWLYVIEHLAGPDPTHYQVRKVDVATGKLQEGVIVDKRNVGENMTGYAVTQEPGRPGWVYTLYRGHDGAFIHALDTTDGIAVCIDLPGSAGSDAAASAAWSLVADPLGDWLYAVNPALKTVSSINLADFSVRLSGSLASSPSAAFAKFGSATPVAGRAALSPDRTILYVIDTIGIAVVRVADLNGMGHFGGTAVFRSVAVGSNGTVYAIDGGGHAVRLAADSAAPTVVADGTYSAIVAVVPPG